MVVVRNGDGAMKAGRGGPGFGESLGSDAIARLQALVADAMLTGAEVSIEDVRQRGESDPGWKDFERLGVRSIVVVPILGSDRGPVAIFALMRREPGAFAPAIVELIQHYT